MTVSDSSRYWIVEQMIWNALEDTALTWGGYLDTWRKQQNVISGRAGRNYKDEEIPDLNAMECPALYFRTGAIATPEHLMLHSDFRRYYPIEIIGQILLERHRETSADKAIKRFQELVERTLGEAHTSLVIANSPYIPSGETQESYIQEILPGSPLFPDWTEENEDAIFVFPIFVQMDFTNYWTR